MQSCVGEGSGSEVAQSERPLCFPLDAWYGHNVESIGLRTNPDKTKVMTCVPGNIRVAHTEEAYHTQQYGPINPTAKRQRVECDICGVSLAAGSLRSHLETKHDTYRSFVLNRELTVEREPIFY
jgi:hypothetical protein